MDVLNQGINLSEKIANYFHIFAKKVTNEKTANQLS
jgi:hypothetical protein